MKLINKQLDWSPKTSLKDAMEMTVPAHPPEPTPRRLVQTGRQEASSELPIPPALFLSDESVHRKVRRQACKQEARRRRGRAGQSVQKVTDHTGACTMPDIEELDPICACVALCCVLSESLSLSLAVSELTYINALL